MKLQPPKERIIRPGRPRIDGKICSILFPNSLYDRIEEYRTFCKHKTGMHPTYTQAVRALINRGLIELGIPDDESEENEADCG